MRFSYQSVLAVLLLLPQGWASSGEARGDKSADQAPDSVEQLVWQRGADPPLARGGYYAASYRGGIVQAGGTYWKNGTKHWTDRVDFYDPQQDRWSELPALPKPLAYGGMVRVGQSLYLLGGTHGEEVHREIYRFQNNRWEEVGRTPAPIFYTAAVAVGSQVYLLAGGSSISDLGQATRDVWTADTGDFQWRKLKPLPGPARVIHTAAAVGNSIYVFGGCRQEPGQPLTNLADAYRLDTRNESWQKVSDAPLAVRAWWAEPSGKQIYLFGGYSDQFLASVYRYDPAADSYHLISHLPLGLCDTKFLRHADGRFYGISGEDKMASRFTGTLVGRPK